MALFAQISPVGKVLRVVVSPLAGASGAAFMTNLLGGRWVETATDGSLHGPYAGKGYFLDGPAVNFYQTLAQSKVAIIGDSVVSQMASQQASMPAPFTGATLLGVSGQTMSQIAARVSSIPATSTHVLIEGGINDYNVLGNSSAIVQSYTTMLNAIPSTQSVIVLGLPRVDEAVLMANIATFPLAAVMTNANIAASNSALVTLCNSYSNCTPAVAWMSRNRNGQTVDGLHFTAAGYLNFASDVLSLL